MFKVRDVFIRNLNFVISWYDFKVIDIATMTFVGKLYKVIKMLEINNKTFIIDTGPTVISGLIAAYISALVVTKIYKNYDIIFVTILPFITILLALIGDILLANEAGWNSKSISVIIREILTIYFYYYLLKEKTI